MYDYEEDDDGWTLAELYDDMSEEDEAAELEAFAEGFAAELRWEAEHDRQAFERYWEQER